MTRARNRSGHAPAGNPTASALRWVPTAWLAMGVVYAFVTGPGAILLRDLGLTTSQAVIVISLFGTPYVIKPAYAPLIEVNRNKRYFAVVAQMILATAFVAAALLAWWGSQAVLYLIAVMVAIAIVGSVQDIACEGLFMTTLDRRQQAALTSVQSIAWNGAALGGGGMLIALSGSAAIRSYGSTVGWASALALCALLYLALAIWHRRKMPLGEHARQSGTDVTTPLPILLSFFRRRHLVPSIALCMSFPLGAGLIEKIESFFLIDGRSQGGLGLSREGLGNMYATTGFVGLALGATLGSWLLMHRDLSRSMLAMGLAAMAPPCIYLGLATWSNVPWGATAVGLLLSRATLAFAMVGYVVYLQRALGAGPFPTSHYNLASGLKALTMVLTGVASGPIQHALGYRGLFICALACGLPMLLLCRQRIVAVTTGETVPPLAPDRTE